MTEYKMINYRGVDIEVSKKGKIKIDGKEKQWYFNHDGYPVISFNLPKKKGSRSVSVHRLVAIAYIPNPQNLPEVNHKDFNRKNPCVENLEWMSHADNVRYSNCNRPDYTGKKNPNYGNTKLSETYKKNKKLAKEKQSRSGTQNGRSTVITVYYDGEFLKQFDYITLCCKYFVEKGIYNGQNIEGCRAQINRAIKNNKPYKEHYTFKKD